MPWKGALCCVVRPSAADFADEHSLNVFSKSFSMDFFSEYGIYVGGVEIGGKELWCSKSFNFFIFRFVLLNKYLDD